MALEWTHSPSWHLGTSSGFFQIFIFCVLFCGHIYEGLDGVSFNSLIFKTIFFKYKFCQLFSILYILPIIFHFLVFVLFFSILFLSAFILHVFVIVISSVNPIQTLVFIFVLFLWNKFIIVSSAYDFLFSSWCLLPLI